MDEGLINKYKLSRLDGTPLSPDNKYFVLKYEGEGDSAHISASRKALEVYADNIEETMPSLAADIHKMLD